MAPNQKVSCPSRKKKKKKNNISWQPSSVWDRPPGQAQGGDGRRVGAQRPDLLRQRHAAHGVGHAIVQGQRGVASSSFAAAPWNIGFNSVALCSPAKSV